MAMNSFGVGFVLNAKDNVSPVIKGISSAFHRMFYDAKEGGDKLTETMARGAIGEGLRRVGAGITAGLAGMSAETGPIEKAIKNVRAVRGESAAMGATISRALNSAAVAELGFTTEQAARAFQGLTLAGHGSEESLAQLGTSLNLAKIGAIETAEAGALLDDFVDIFGGTLEDSSKRVDKIAWSMRQFGVGGNQIAQMLQTVAPSAQLVNASFEDMTMATGMVASVIPSAGKAAGAVQMAFMQLADENKQKELKKLGVEVMDADQKFVGLDKVLVGIIESTKEMGEAERATALRTVFGGRAAGGMAVIMGKLEDGITTTTGEVLKGADAVAYMTAEMERSGGMSATMAKEMTTVTEAADAQSKRLRTSLGTAFRELLEPGKRLKGEVLGGLADVLDRFSPETRKAVLGVVGAFGGLIAMTGSLIIATTVLDRLGLTFKGFMITVGKGLLFGGPVLLLLAGIGAGLYAAFNAIDKRGKGSVTIMDKFKLGWKGMLDLLSSRSLSKETQKALASPEMSGVGGFLDWMSTFLTRWDAFWVGLQAGWQRGVAALGPEIDAFVARFDALSDIFGGGKAADDLDAWGASGERAGEGLASIGRVGLEVLTGLLDVMQRIGEKLDGLTADQVADGILGVVDAFKQFYEITKGLLEFLNAIKDVIMIVAAPFRALGSLLGDAAYGASVSGMKIGKAFGADYSDEEIKAAEGALGVNWQGAKEQLFTAVDYARGYSDEDKADEDARNAQRNKRMQITALRRNYQDVMAAGQGQLAAISGPNGLPGNVSKERVQQYSKEMTSTLSSLAKAINDLAGKELVARVEYETLGKAMNRAIGDEDGRSLSPNYGAAY